MSQKVFVTGLGTISAIGDNVQQSYQSLKSSKTGIGQMRHLKTRHKEIPVGEVRHSDEELMEMVGITEKSNYTRTALLGMIAAQEAYRHAGLTSDSGKRIGLISATTVGGMDKTELFYNDFFDEQNQSDSLGFIDTHDCGDSAEKIAGNLGITDFITTISTACSSSLNSIMFGARLIKHGLLDAAVVGGVDALAVYTLNGFNTLKILDYELCKPFDDQRRGLNLGEGAGFLVIESEESANKTGKETLCELRGYANANDAFHETGSSPDGNGAFLAMTKALQVGNLTAEDIDYVNVHGTGTENNDLSEGRAMERLFKNIPDFSSTKAFTGHTLGAAGAIEAIYSILVILNGEVFPNLNFKQQMNELSFQPVTELKSGAGIKNVMTNSFGFGGNNSVLIFGKN